MVIKEVCEFASVLKNLTVNSKGLIYALTMLADVNVLYAEKIVELIEVHLTKLEPREKLPTIYLIESIVKHLGGVYTGMFELKIADIFSSVYEKVDIETKRTMFFRLRTWNDVFSSETLEYIELLLAYPDLKLKNVPKNLPGCSTRSDDQKESKNLSPFSQVAEYRNFDVHYPSSNANSQQYLLATNKRLSVSKIKRHRAIPPFVDVNKRCLCQSTNMYVESSFTPVTTEEERLPPVPCSNATAQDSNEIMMQPSPQQYNNPVSCSNNDLPDNLER